MTQSTNMPDKITIDRGEYEFLEAVVERIDEFLNAPFPRFRDDALEWLKDTLGDELDDDDAKARQARVDDTECEHCRKLLVRAFAWKARQRRIEPAPVLTLHRHSDRVN